MQALERTQPVLPMRPGQPERRTSDYVRHGTSSLFAALDVAAGRVIVNRRAIGTRARRPRRTHPRRGGVRHCRRGGRRMEPPVEERGVAGPQVRVLRRQLALPVSRMSQWCVRRSSRAVVIFASPNTLGHSANGRLVVTITEVRS
jgi:hypothetical protein